MKNKEFMMLQLFAEGDSSATPAEPAAGTTTTADMAPAISVDFTSRISKNIVELQKLLGITDLIPMSAGTDIKIYKWTVDELADQVGEGKTIGLTKVTRTLANTISLALDKYRRNNKAVKKTLSIPQWLADEAEKNNLSLSKVLQEGLKTRLGL